MNPRSAKNKGICASCKLEVVKPPSVIAKSKNIFCNHKCYSEFKRTLVGEKANRWKGGRFISSWGYVLVYKPDHPNSDCDGYVREHRLVMEQKIGRLLRSDEEVNHINRIKTDNRPENLEVLSKAEHGRKSGMDSRGVPRPNGRGKRKKI